MIFEAAELLFSTAVPTGAAWHMATKIAPRQIAAYRAGAPLRPRLRAQPLDPVSIGINPNGGMTLGRLFPGGPFVQGRKDDNLLIVAPPRWGKSLGPDALNIIAASGSVYACSSRPDLYVKTAKIRAAYGDVLLYDPLGIVPEYMVVPGTRRIHYSPKMRGLDWDYCQQRANSIMERGGEGLKDAKHWRDRGAQWLACAIHAATLKGWPMTAIITWVGANDTHTVATILAEDSRSHPMARSWMEGFLKQYDAEGNPTGELGTTYTTISTCLKPFGNSAILASADAAERYVLDFDEIVTQPTTIYAITPSDMVGSDLAVLNISMMEELRSSVNYHSRSGYLTNRMRFVFDELSICPVPQLLAILAECGGRGLDCVVTLQTMGQADRWGPSAFAQLLDLCGDKMFLGGIGDEKLRSIASELCGTHDRWISHGSGKRSERSYHHITRPNVSPDKVRRLKRGTALVISGGRRYRKLRLAPAYRRPFTTWAAAAVPLCRCEQTVRREPQMAPVLVGAPTIIDVVRQGDERKTA